MKWSFNELNLKWYQYIWVMLPIGVAAIGGGIGGLCGALGVAANVVIMRKPIPAALKYSATAGVTLITVGAYFVLARLFLIVLGGGSITALRVDHDLAASPTFVAIQKADPDSYKKIRQAMIDAVDAGKSPEQVAAVGRPYVSAIALRYLPIASDQAVIGSTQVTTLEIDQIGAKNADACVTFLSPRPDAPFDITAFITPEVMKLDAEATAKVIESGASNPGKVPSQEEIAPALRAVSQALIAKYGAQNVTALSQPASLDHSLYCSMISDFYKDILQLPLPAGVPVLRFLYSRHPTA
jgi:hypothetical protein